MQERFQEDGAVPVDFPSPGAFVEGASEGLRVSSLIERLRADRRFSVSFALRSHAFNEAVSAEPAEVLSSPASLDEALAGLLAGRVSVRLELDGLLSDNEAAPGRMSGLALPAALSRVSPGCGSVPCAFSAWRSGSPVSVPCSGGDLYAGGRCCIEDEEGRGRYSGTCSACPLFPFAFVLVAFGSSIEEDDILLLELVRERVLRVVEGARYNSAARKSAGVERTITKAIQMMGEASGVERKLGALLGMATAMLAADAGAVFRCELHADTVRIVVSHGISDEDGKGGLGRLREVVEEVVSGGKPVLLRDIGGERLDGTRLEAESLLALPLHSEGAVKWVLLLVGASPSNRFCMADLLTAEVLAMFGSTEIHNAILYGKVEEKGHLQRLLLNKVINAQEDERKRIASDIHDDTIQSLISSYYRLEGIEMMLDEGRLGEAREELARTRGDVQANIGSMRRLLFELRPALLDDAGLIPALENYLARMKKETGIETVYYVQEGIERFTSETEITAYRLAQEILTNVRKHACATEVEVKVKRPADHLELTVKDNGVGFDLEAALGRDGHEEHLGLRSVMERAELADGKVEIRTAQGRGTEVHIKVPDQRC